MSYPTSPEAVTAEWLAEVLETEVRSFEVQPFGEGASVVGQVARVQLDGNPSSLIAKFPSPAEANRAVAAAYDMYGREVDFYNQTASQVQMRTPRCYFGAVDRSSNSFVLLLEDLSRFRVGDQVTGCSAEDARAVVKSLARFHASAWNPDHLGLPSHNNPAQRDGMIAGFQAGWPVIMERFRHLVPDAALAAETGMPAATGWLLEEMCTPPVSISHADVRLDNVFFDDDSGEVFFVDWQSVCTSSPEQDLAYFITQNIPPTLIDHAELLTLYLERLNAEGIQYSREQLDRRYSVSALYLLNYAVVIAGTLDMGNERGTKLAETLLGGAMQSLDAMGAFKLLEESH